MRKNYDKGFDFVIKWERYISNIPGDRGGLTIWGVASAFWPNEVSAMQKMSKEESLAYVKRDFYIKNFWLPCGCDELHYPLDIVVFDTAVNCGVSRALKFLADTRARRNWINYLMLRTKFYIDSPQEAMDDGWINRVLDLYWILRNEEFNEHPISEERQV